MLQLDAVAIGDGVKGDMMELQSLQEALKVEIQVHQKLVAQMKQDPQNSELKKQLHELQAKITALSEKQKKVVEQLRKELLVKQEPDKIVQSPPLGGDNRTIQNPPTQTLTVMPLLTAKPLPLVLKATPTFPMVTPTLPQRPPTVAMVTTSIAKSDSQNAPINLQVASKPTNQSSEPIRLVSKNTLVVQTTSSSAQPIKVPQFVPPRLTPRPTFQPQVRPKPAAPINVPIAPAPPPPMMAASQILQRPVMLATKLSPASLPSNAPIHQVRIVNGQPTAPLAGIVITSPVSTATTRLTSPAHTPSPAPSPTQPISSVSSDTKVVKPAGELVKSSSTPPNSPPPARPKREENPQKLAFMVSLGLVTHDHLEEIQSRRQERKRRTTANPVYSGAVFEPERKKTAVSYLNSPLHQGTRKRGRPPKYSVALDLAPPTSPLPAATPSPAGDGDIHEDFCTVCRRSGQLLMCDTCARVYHLDCLAPPLKSIPKGMWICPKCQDQILKKEEAIPWPGTLAIVHSYIAYKEAKEEEKQKLMKWSSELKLEREQLEQRVKQLSHSITKCMETKNSILARQKEMQLSLEKVKHLVCLIQSFNFSKMLLEDPVEKTVVEPSIQHELCSESISTPVDQSGSSVGEGSGSISRDQSGSNVGEGSGSISRDQSGSSVVEGSGSCVVKGSMSSPGNTAGSGSSLVEGSGSSVGCGSSVGQGSGSSVGCGSSPGDRAGSGSSLGRELGSQEGCVTCPSASTNGSSELAGLDDTLSETNVEVNNSKTSEPSQLTLQPAASLD